MNLAAIISWVITIIITGCQSPRKTPDMSGLSNGLVQNENPYRNPVILIPGLLGSHLIERESEEVAWDLANPAQDKVLSYYFQR